MREGAWEASVFSLQSGGGTGTGTGWMVEKEVGGWKSKPVVSYVQTERKSRFFSRVSRIYRVRL